MFTATANLILPSTTTGSFPRPRWFDVSMWGRPLDTCMMDVRFREKFQDAMAVVISDEQRAGLDILTHGDFHCDEDFAGRSWHHYPLQRWSGFEGDHLQSEQTRSPWLKYPPGTLHFMANTFGPNDDKVKFMIECYNREVQGLDDVEIWIHTCWGNPNMQRVMEDTSYKASFELYLNEMKGDVWTIETKDRNFADIELFGAYKGKLPKKICIGAVSHRSLQADRPEDVAGAIRTALKHIAPEQLIVSSDCGFGRQGANREIAFYKASAIAQGCNIVRKELGFPTSYVPAADPTLQLDIVPKTAT